MAFSADKKKAVRLGHRDKNMAEGSAKAGKKNCS